jgi:hypothetical protein
MPNKKKKAPTKTIAKNVIKAVLGQVPFTAELYWMTRHRDKSLNSRFSLTKLKDNLPEICEYVAKMRNKKHEKGKKVFIFASLHYWIEHAAVTGLILSGMGNDVTLGYLPYHDWQNDITRFDQRRQNLYAHEILKKAEPFLNSISLLDLHAGYKVLPEALEEKIQEVTRFDAMYTQQIENVDENSDIYKLRYKRNVKAARAAYEYLGKNKPDVVIVPNGTIQEFGVIYEVARFLNIEIVTYEFGDQRQRIWIAQNSKIMQQDTQAMWDAYKEDQLTRTEKDKIRELFEARRKASVWKNFSRLWQHVPAQGVEIARGELGLDERPVVLLATNVLGDSLTLGRKVFSNTMEEWLERTLQYFVGKTESQLIIRIHPGEMLIHGQSMVEVINRVLPSLPDHIHVIGPEEKVNTYDLIAAADLGLVYTTTVGLEMAMSGVPVIVVGNTHYRERGFTHDPDGWVRYYKTINAILEDPASYKLSKEQIDLAWAYAYRFFFNFPLPFPYHLVNLWEDYRETPLSELFKSNNWKEYEPVFQFLVGEEIDWKAVKHN